MVILYFFDKVRQTISYCLILILKGYDVDIASLQEYKQYSVHLEFMLNPEEFNYSKVDTRDNMWVNLIYSQQYGKYFLEHKKEIITDELVKLFRNGLANENQQKILYGFLLDKAEIGEFAK